MITNAWKMLHIGITTTLFLIVCVSAAISATLTQTKTQRLAPSIDGHLVEALANQAHPQLQQQKHYQRQLLQQLKYPHAFTTGYIGASGVSAGADGDADPSGKQQIHVFKDSHDHVAPVVAVAVGSTSGTQDSSDHHHEISNAIFNVHLTGPHEGFLSTFEGYGKSLAASLPHHRQQKYLQHYRQQQQPSEKISDRVFFHHSDRNSGYNELEYQAQQQQHLYRQQQQHSYWHPQQDAYSAEVDGPSFKQQEQPTSSGYDEPSSNTMASGHGIQQHPPPDVINYVPYPVVKKLHVPIHENVKIPVSHAVILPISKPVPIHIPVTQQVQVPVEKELKIPVERVVPYPVERHVPVPVEKRVPYPLVKYLPVKIPQPFPVKVPVFKTILHKVKSLW